MNELIEYLQWRINNGDRKLFYEDCGEIKIVDAINSIKDLQQERDFYKNIVEELKKYIKHEIKYIKMNYSQINGSYFNMDYVLDTYKKILSKLEELEKGDNK